MKKLDLKGTYRHLYTPRVGRVEVVEVPELSFLMLDGEIEPGHEPGTSPAFAEAMAAMYGAAYTLKFMVKKRPKDPVDYPVMATEGIWWVRDGVFDITRKDTWSWRLMILQPDLVTSGMLAEALDAVRKKKPSPAMEKLLLERYREGLCVQAMHVGPYSTEPETVERMRAFERDNGLVARHEAVAKARRLKLFDHHEIYLGDPRRTAPEKLRTVLRHPVRRA